MSIEKEIITGTLYSPDEVSEIVIDDFSFQGTWTDSDTTLPSSVSSNTAFENVCATSKITVSGGTAGFKKVYFDTTDYFRIQY